MTHPLLDDILQQLLVEDGTDGHVESTEMVFKPRGQVITVLAIKPETPGCHYAIINGITSLFGSAWRLATG